MGLLAARISQKQDITIDQNNAMQIKEISDNMSSKEAAEIYLREIKDPSISQAINEKNAKKRKPKAKKEKK